MSVIIRLQNLPWSANALDIRNFFKGLAIPEGGVHIVGGELGDAFIAFSTDEDARLAMQHDRESINEIQVRLLLSSRAEMQKIIETARQVSLLAMQNNAAAIPVSMKMPAAAPTLIVPPMVRKPMSLTADPNSLAGNLQAQSKATAFPELFGAAPSFLAYQKDAGITLIERQDMPAALRSGGDVNDSPNSRLGRSTSREHRRSRSRERNDHNGPRYVRHERSRSPERLRHTSRRSRSRERSRDRSRDRSSECVRDKNRHIVRRRHNSRDNDIYNSRTGQPPGRADSKESDSADAKSGDPDMGRAKMNVFVSKYVDLTEDNAAGAVFSNSDSIVVKSNASAIGGQNTSPNSLTLNPFNAFGNGTPNHIAKPSAVATTTKVNTFGINFFGMSNTSTASDAVKSFALQNPYTAAQQVATVNSNSQDSSSSSTLSTIIQKAASAALLVDGTQQVTQTSTTTTSISSNFQQVQQESITFANTNPYARMYPKLFEQANIVATVKADNQSSPGDKKKRPPDNSSIRISNMCSTTSYSELRKFFAGLYIPHNGIKMVYDKNGSRIGTALVQFKRPASVQDALQLNNNALKSNRVTIEKIPDDEFDKYEDAYSPAHFERGDPRSGSGDSHSRRDDNSGNEHSPTRNPFNTDRRSEPPEPFSVLYIEDIPTMGSERDLMKMFSSYTIYDILMMPSPENRREFIAYVKFSRDDDAKAAFEDKSNHIIGYRKVRVRPSKEDDMTKAKEKVRLATEQLMKEEAAENELKEKQKKAEEEDNKKRKHRSRFDVRVDDKRHDHDEPTAKMSDMRSRDPRQQSSIPSLFQVSAQLPQARKIHPADPRLHRQLSLANADSGDSNGAMSAGGGGGGGGGGGLGHSNANASASATVSSSSNKNDNNNMLTSLYNSFGVNFNNLQQQQIQDLQQQQLQQQLQQMQQQQMQQQQQQMQQQFQMNYGNSMSMNNNTNNNNNNNNNISSGFVLLKNCDYNTRVGDVGELFNDMRLDTKHVEPLRNDRNMPTGEFIVELCDGRDVEKALRDLNGTQFRMRTLRMRSITPQEIADKLGKPFMNCYPGGGGGGGGNFNNNNNNNNNNNKNNSSNNKNQQMQGNFDPFNRGGGPSQNSSQNNFFDSNNSNSMRYGANNTSTRNRTTASVGSGNGGGNRDNGTRGRSIGRGRGGKSNGNDRHDEKEEKNSEMGMPDKFTRPGCVISMENVPFTADLNDILVFFKDYSLTSDDVIRRYNDDGTPTGDARVVFETPAVARAALDANWRKTIFNRSIYLSLL